MSFWAASNFSLTRHDAKRQLSNTLKVLRGNYFEPRIWFLPKLTLKRKNKIKAFFTDIQRFTHGPSLIDLIKQEREINSKKGKWGGTHGSTVNRKTNKTEFA